MRCRPRRRSTSRSISTAALPAWTSCGPTGRPPGCAGRRWRRRCRTRSRAEAEGVSPLQDRESRREPAEHWSSRTWSGELAPLVRPPPRCARSSPPCFAHGAETVEECARRAGAARGARTRSCAPRRAALASQVVERRRADDGFVKYLFESPLGGRVEAVRIPHLRREVRRLRVEPGRLRAGVRLLRDRAAGLPAQPRRRGRSWTRCCRSAPRRTAGARRGVHGDGRAAAQPHEAAPAAATHHVPPRRGYAISGKAITFSTAGWVPAIRRYAAPSTQPAVEKVMDSPEMAKPRRVRHHAAPRGSSPCS